MMSMNFAESIAAAMVEIRRPAWQVAGCRRMLLDYAHEAPTVPIGEIGAAALIYAQTPTIQVPSLELFRAGPWWRNSVAHERTQRPSEQPKCEDHGLFLPCRSCAAEAKAHPDDAPHVDPNQHTDEHVYAYTVGPAMARQAMKDAGIPTNGEVR